MISEILKIQPSLETVNSISKMVERSTRYTAQLERFSHINELSNTFAIMPIQSAQFSSLFGSTGDIAKGLGGANDFSIRINANQHYMQNDLTAHFKALEDSIYPFKKYAHMFEPDTGLKAAMKMFEPDVGIQAAMKMFGERSFDVDELEDAEGGLEQDVETPVSLVAPTAQRSPNFGIILVPEAAFYFAAIPILNEAWKILTESLHIEGLKYFPVLMVLVPFQRRSDRG